jgi:hypothetical protein
MDAKFKCQTNLLNTLFDFFKSKKVSNLSEKFYENARTTESYKQNKFDEHE